MKNFLIRIYFGFICCVISYGQSIEIDRNFNTDSLDRNANLYECKEPEFQFEEGLAKINFSADHNTLYIKNISNTGYTGIEILFEINKKLEITEIEYYTWDDIEDGSSTDYSIQDYFLKLNKNPFAEGIENLEGVYNIEIKSTFKPGKSPSDRALKSRTKTFNYKGYFDCK